MKGIIIWLSVAMAAIFGLSYFASIPYIYTILGLVSWAFIGHIVTVDDDRTRKNFAEMVGKRLLQYGFFQGKA